MAFLQSYAAEHDCPLYTALERNIDDELFKNTKAKRLLSLVDRLSAERHAKPVSELLSDVLDGSGYEAMLRTEGSQERLDNLAELKQSVYEYEASCGEETTLEGYLARIALLVNADADSGGSMVRMMTVHTAKGLEFPHVFLCGLSEGLFPSKKTATAQAMEEERRLAFVAFTRACDALYLSEAEGRNLDGSFRVPSRFLFDVDPKLLRLTAPLPGHLTEEAAARIAAADREMAAAAAQKEWRVGDRVVHSVMGPGEILDINLVKSAYLVRFDELGTERLISFKARLYEEK